MRGFIQGSLWGLILGGITVSTVSYLDDQGMLGLGGPVAPASEAPEMGVDVPALATAPEEGTLPRLPFGVRAPFIDPFVPVLANTARLPQPPSIDGSVPAALALDEPAPQAAPEPEPASEPAPTVTVAEAPAPDPEPVPDPEPAPEVDTAQAPVETEPQAPAIIVPQDDGTQTAQVTDEDTGVVVNRLGVGTTETAGQVAEVVVEDVIDEDAPALERFAATFDNPEGLPVLGIVLIDSGSSAASDAALAGLGFPATVVVNALDPDAAALMRAYRAAGAEVAMELALPQGALPADVEVAFEAAAGMMSEAVMLYSEGGDAIQANRQTMTQVMEVLTATGMGLVAEERGLGGAIRAAEQAGVPAVAIDRDLDGGGASSGAIGRALDQAAFRARQSGDAVLLARLDDATLSALRDWAAANGDSGTVIGPVSAILLRP